MAAEHSPTHAVITHCDEPMHLVEIRWAYDGALFLECMKCGAWRHRFPNGHWLRERSNRHAHLYDAAKEIRP